MHKHLIKWLSEIIKKMKGEYYICYLLGDAVLNIQKFKIMLQKKWLLAWKQKKQITNSVLISSIVAKTC